MPDFLVIGAGKSGTTSINNYLAQHPQIFMSPRKEPNFFAYETIDKETLRHDPPQYEYYLQSVTQLEDYLALFAGAQEGQLIGETSNTYLYTPAAYHRIEHYIPQAKLIAILRHPADRLYSRFLHLSKYNQPPTPNFRDALNRDSVWWQRPDLIHEGLYYTHLSNYFDLFNPERIKIYLYDDLSSDLHQMLKSMFSFLGVKDNFQPDTSVTYNTSGIVKNRVYNKVMGQNGIVQKSIKTLLPNSQYESLKKNNLIHRTLDNFRNINLRKPAIDPEIRNKLIKEVYHDEIQNLQSLINRDLSLWLKT